jgi:hypothetical protein
VNDGSNREAEADRNLKASDRRLPASWLNKCPPRHNLLDRLVFLFSPVLQVPSTACDRLGRIRNFGSASSDGDQDSLPFR